MTAEELIIKNLDESDINCGATWIDDSLEPVLEVVIKTMEQYTKAKVIEALEEKNVQIANKQLEALEYHLPRYQRWMDDRASIEVTGEEFEAFKKQSKAYIEECIITKQS